MMTANGVAKTIEEIGGLQQVLGKLQQTLGKKLALWTRDDHWDGTNLKDCMEEEVADVIAALACTTVWMGLSTDFISGRVTAKIERFERWHAETDNNKEGIDAK